ncbi:ParB/Srx family N-terminal domain-containing protein [Phaeobacter gallaeciensis]|uniref:ParB/Srx family N-terminal domain-containing protein n=1 Tax=Phaeobacter gallaeciensis TaxID=60890 RepID=UPI0023802563|nr:ParB/Srx family N-terminal domain-containing protein [Phaeobacter gallaeciensis]MDE4297103.1 ParB/Srx family N-terminal domain-containing protein [Phaeobacter gallaeciensis]
MSRAEEAPRPVEIWDIEKLIPYELNAKKHPEDQVRKLATAISTFGWSQPIVVWTNGEIIAGHGRRLAALHLGLKKVPVDVRSDLTKAEADALRLADNRVTSTEYDMGMIQDELRRLEDELGDMNIQLTDLGFDDKEVDFSTADLGEIDDSFFADDIGAAVEQQRQENEASIEETDQTAAPVGDALGFKRVSVMQSREIRSLMAKIEEETGNAGPDALIYAMRELVGDVA